MLPVSDQVPRNSSWQGPSCTPVIISSFEHHTDDSTNWFGSIPTLRDHTVSGQGPSTSTPLPSTSREDLRLDSYLEYLMPQRHYTFTYIQAFSEI
ncbi:hypothetical protein TNCV_4898871 [Trichonephila clavipes]|nr:hypothetical protein TNCV_4898871 [Trichonephila clavipes]